MAKSAEMPNLLRCKSKDCAHTVPFDGQPLPARCDVCGGPATIRCGSSPRPSSGRDHPCYAACKPGKRCGKHGGKALKGPASPRWKHGRHSKYVPGRWLESYGEALSDPMAQRQMTRQLALMRAMEDDFLQRLSTTESGESWEEAGKSAAKVRRQLAILRGAQAGKDKARAGQAVGAIMELLETELLPVLEQGAREEAAMEELQALWIRRGRLIRVQQQGEDKVPVETLSALQARFAALISKYLADDPRKLAHLVSELREAAMPGWMNAGLDARSLAENAGKVVEAEKVVSKK